MKKGDVLWRATGDRLDNVKAEPVTVWEVLPNGQCLVQYQSGAYSLFDADSPRMFSSAREALLDWGTAALYSVEEDVEYFEDHLKVTTARLEEKRALLKDVKAWAEGVQNG